MNLNDYANQAHQDNLKWWLDPSTGRRITRNKGELISLMHSELSEMLEGIRKDKTDEHVPAYSSEEVELADLLIRAFDYAGAHGLRLQEAYEAKREYNRTRADHTHAARMAPGGKKW